MHECKGCTAKDYTIAILREQLRNREAELELVHGEYAQLVEELNTKLDFTIGMRKPVETDPDKKLNPIRRSMGIGSRLRKAEQASRKPELIEQRRKEYDARINSILNPDLNDAILVENEDAKIS